MYPKPIFGFLYDMNIHRVDTYGWSNKKHENAPFSYSGMRVWGDGKSEWVYMVCAKRYFGGVCNDIEYSQYAIIITCKL